MKRIAFVSWDMTVLGGVNQVTVTLANEFAEYYDVYIVSLVKGSGAAEPVLKPQVHDISFIQERECRGREVILEGGKKLRKFLADNKIDVLFLMGFQVALPVIIMAGKNRCKYVFCDHEALMSRWHERKITLVRYLAAVMSDKVITLTKKNALDYQKHFHLSEKKLDYIYNSINENVIRNRSAQYDDNSKIILSVGRFSPEKGYDMLLDVAENVLKKNTDWKWVIYGTGETFSQVQTEISERNLEEKIILKGEVKDVSGIYKQAAMFVLTSRREGLPLVLLEAKVNHLPCVSFDIVSGPNEIIRDQIDGFLVDPFDKEEMINKIEQLIVDDELRIKMACEADKDLEKFSAEKIVERWRRLIESL